MTEAEGPGSAAPEERVAPGAESEELADEQDAPDEEPGSDVPEDAEPEVNDGNGAPSKPQPAIALMLAILLVIGIAVPTFLFVRGRPATYAAKVNGTVITQSQLNQYLADIGRNKQYVTNVVDQSGGGGPFEGTSGAGSYGANFVASLLTSLIERAVIHQVLVDHHGLPKPAGVASAKTAVAKQQYFSSYPVAYQNVLITQQAEVDAFVSVESSQFTQAQVNSYYQDNQGNYATETCARNIVVANKNSTGTVDLAASQIHAAQIKAMLDGGADFATLAMKDSADTGTNGTASAGGKITGSAPDGCLSSSDLRAIATTAPGVVQSIVTLPLNKVSDPVQTSFGIFLIEVTSRQIQPLASVIGDIRQNLAGQELLGLLQRATINVNPKFGTYNKTVGSDGTIQGVVPPKQG